MLLPSARALATISILTAGCVFGPVLVAVPAHERARDRGDADHRGRDRSGAPRPTRPRSSSNVVRDACVDGRPVERFDAVFVQGGSQLGLEIKHRCLPSTDARGAVRPPRLRFARPSQ